MYDIACHVNGLYVYVTIALDFDEKSRTKFVKLAYKCFFCLSRAVFIYMYKLIYHCYMFLQITSIFCK